MDSNITTAIWLHESQNSSAPAQSKTLSYIFKNRQAINLKHLRVGNDLVYLFIADRDNQELEELSLQLV